MSRPEKKAKKLQWSSEEIDSNAEAQLHSKSLQEQGNVCASLGQYQAAIRCWQEALRYSSTPAIIYEQLSQVYLELDRTFPAIQAAEAGCKLDPTWAEVWLSLTRAQAAHGELEMALSSCVRSVRCNPTLEDAWNELKAIKEARNKKKMSKQ